MAHKICTALDKAEGKHPKKCHSGCKHYKFGHLETACILSEVFSVKKDKDCYIYEDKN